ncbi:MAG: hypothetical protein ABJD11_11775, partial [Gemmatimonadota bacterium]
MRAPALLAPLSVSVRLRSIGTSSVTALRMYWPTALLILGTVVIALLTVLPMTALWIPGTAAGTRLALPPEIADPAVHWRTLPQFPDATRAAAIKAIFALLIGCA